MNQPAYAEAPVLDIISFGYKKMFQNLWNLTKISLPILLFIGIVGGFLLGDIVLMASSQSLQAGSPEVITKLLFLLGVFLLVLLLCSYIAGYVNLRYVKDVYYDDVDTNLYSYLIPEEHFWGILGIGLLYVLMALVVFSPAIIAAVIFAVIMGPWGALMGYLLVLPLMLVWFFINIKFFLTFYVYLSEPEQGLIGSFSRSWQLTADNFWRSVGFGLVIYIIQSILNTPANILMEILKFIAGFNPDFAASPLFMGISAIVIIFMVWSFIVLSAAGPFLGYRYYFDLNARKGLPRAEDIISLRNLPPQNPDESR